MNLIGIKQQLRKPRGIVLSGPLSVIPTPPEKAEFSLQVSDFLLRDVSISYRFSPDEGSEFSLDISNLELRSAVVTYPSPKEDGAGFSMDVVEVLLREVVKHHALPPEDGTTFGLEVLDMEFENPVIRLDYDSEASGFELDVLEIVLDEL